MISYVYLDVTNVRHTDDIPHAYSLSHTYACTCTYSWVEKSRAQQSTPDCSDPEICSPNGLFKSLFKQVWQELGVQKPIGSITRKLQAYPDLREVCDFEILVGEDSAVDGLASGSISPSKITALEHESRDDPMEVAPLVVERDPAPAFALLPRAKLSEVLSRLGDDLCEQLKHALFEFAI